MSFQSVTLDQRLLTAMENADIGYYVWDLQMDRCVFCTEKLAEIHGMTAADYLAGQRTIKQDALFVHPEDRARYLATFEGLLDKGTPYRIDYRIVRADGTVRHVREIETTTEFEDGVPIRAEGTIQDLTATVELETKLRQAQKLEAIGNLTGGVAHDFNNILAVILGNLEMLRHQEPEDASAELIEAAIDAGLRGADLVRKMLSFAKRVRLEPKTINLNDLVVSTKSWSARVLPENIEIETALDCRLWAVRADVSSVENALLNLVLNARDAMPGGGKLIVETSNMQIGPDGHDALTEGIAPGRYVALTVTDAGSGIPEDKLSLIFEPFYTTKPPGEGSGLGLSMIQGFMTQSGGEIRVSSSLGVGTAFRLYFPAHVSAEAVPTAKRDKVDTGRVAASDASIVLVEDEPALLTVLGKILRDAGYRVQSASSGDEALEMFLNGATCDVLITDIVMPGKNDGPALVSRLREMYPLLPAVFLSGYTRGAVEDGIGQHPRAVRLMKPVDRNSLIAAVEEALQSAARGPAGSIGIDAQPDGQTGTSRKNS